ncbi:carboxypeptidase-like regulatory domain-containing protein [Mesorhizobium sp. M0924]|uniref:carboxypeptidase-like regulatory domain-containing protein n=1 Tax=unclassified Mesorhizobium TaxID=325217 RepID=UPI003334CCB8
MSGGGRIGRQHQVVVRDAGGRPVAGALVEVARGTAPVPEVGRVTDAEGRLWLHLPPGSFTLQAETATGESGQAQADGEDDSTIEIKVRK